jgi:hypothetical protein
MRARSCRRTARRCTCSPNRAMPWRMRRPFSRRPAPAPRAPRRASSATSRPSRPGPTATSPAPSRCTRSRRANIRATWCRSSWASTTASTPATAPACCGSRSQCCRTAADVPYVHGMAAFGYEQCHLMREAEASARRAIAMCRKEPWAHHALAHVMLTEGRLAEGLAFMESVSDTWIGLNSFMVTHNWWHVALFLIDLGRDAEALAVYDEHAWGVVKDYSQDQIGAVSLLARLELAGIDVGARWNDVAALPAAAPGRPCAALPRPAVPLRPRARGTGRGRCAAAQHRGLRARTHRRRRAPHGNASACRPRTGWWPMRAATLPGRRRAWAWRCRA